MIRHIYLVMCFSLAGLLTLPVIVNANPPKIGVVQFGAPMPREHDANDHAGDNVVPRTTVISVGGTVYFVMNGGVHQLAIYAPGVGPDDIDESVKIGYGGCAGGGDRYIDDPTDRLAIYDPPCAGGLNPVPHTFNEPGRYFIMCTFDSHFEVGMWGWVIVK